MWTLTKFYPRGTENESRLSLVAVVLSPISFAAEKTVTFAKSIKQRAPDLIIRSEPYTMPAHGQDVWYKPTTEIPVTEPRWVRAVEMRPASAAGSLITRSRD